MQTNRDVLEKLEELAKRDEERGSTHLQGRSFFVFDGNRVRDEPGTDVLDFLRKAPDNVLDAAWPERWNEAPEPEPQADGDGGEKSPPDPDPEQTEPEPSTPEEPKAETAQSTPTVEAQVGSDEEPGQSAS